MHSGALLVTSTSESAGYRDLLQTQWINSRSADNCLLDLRRESIVRFRHPSVFHPIQILLCKRHHTRGYVERTFLDYPLTIFFYRLIRVCATNHRRRALGLTAI